MTLRSGVWAAAAWLAVGGCAPSDPTLSYERGVIVADGINGAEPPGGWSETLQVRTSDAPDAPMLLGAYERRGDRLMFTPTYPPAPDLTLRATLLDHGAVAAELVVPGKSTVAASTTEVSNIYPSADVWPENALRLYLEFSAPMSAGYAYDHVRMLDAAGDEIIDPFVEIDPELWSPDQTRLTILFDPGRVKRGLVDNEESGPPLIAGHEVTLEVDPAWPDATGAPLIGGASKQILVGPSLRRAVDIADWSITRPPDRMFPLTIRFPSPMDEALARRMIDVLHDDRSVPGSAAFSEAETVWTFHPEADWSAGDYTIRVDGRIEDLAGNRLGRVFDVDRMDPTQSREAHAFAEATFSIP